MRLIAISNVSAYWTKHPETKASLERWVASVESASWTTTAEVQAEFAKAKVLNGERVRFQIGDGDYRLIATFKFKNQICYVSFIGTHTEYDRVDALTIWQF